MGVLRCNSVTRMLILNRENGRVRRGRERVRAGGERDLETKSEQKNKGGKEIREGDEISRKKLQTCKEEYRESFYSLRCSKHGV